MKRYINAKPIGLCTPDEFSAHLKGIMAHTQKLRADRKAKAKARLDAGKKPSRAWSCRVNRKGTVVISIRNRDPKYLTQAELAELFKENPGIETLVHAKLVERGIDVVSPEV